MARSEPAEPRPVGQGLTRTRMWLEHHTPTQGAVFVFLLLAVVYGATGDYDGGLRHNADTVAAAAPAQRIVTSGDLDMTSFQERSPWFVEVGDRYVADRPPGATLLAIPFYTVSRWSLEPDEHNEAPSVVAAYMITATAMAVLYLVLRSFVPGVTALGTSLLIGLATPTWSISATALWPHGPGQLALAGVMLAFVRRKQSWTLWVAGAFALLIRPLLAIPLATIGIGLMVSKRWKEAGWLAAGGITGIAGLVAWNAYLFADAMSGSPYGENFASAPAQLTPEIYLMRLAGAVFDPTRGVIGVTPFVVVCVVLAFTKSEQLHRTAKLFGVAGLAYLLAHLAFNRFNPAFASNYRYWLESVTLAAPLVAIGIERARKAPPAALLLALTAGWALFFQGLHVFELNPIFGTPAEWLPWYENR